MYSTIYQNANTSARLQTVPTTQAFDYRNLPVEIKVLPNWVCFLVNPDPARPGKFLKEPYNPNTGEKASHSNSSTWTMYAIAVSKVEDGTYDALGFALPLDGSYVFLDLDECIDVSTGRISPEAQEIIDEFATYTEVSVSGTGAHALAKGNLPASVKTDIELYSSRRFMVCTGNRIPDTPATIEYRQREITKLYEEHRADELPPTSSSNSPVIRVDLTDDQIIEKARAASNGQKFTALWSGDCAGFDSHSEADEALCCHLAFWTGNDATRIDALFRRSSLYRRKWETAYYRNRTIKEAIGRTPETYTGRKPEVTETARPDAAEVLRVPKKNILSLLRKKSPLLLPRQPVEYLVDGLIVKGMFTVVAGSGSSGKSTIILHWCISHFLPAGCDVLYLDRDNCLATVQDVLPRIVGDRLPDNFYYWGNWLLDDHGCDVPVPDMSEALVEVVQQLKSPVIIFDTLRKFARCDENDNTEMGNFISAMKMLTTRFNATVILIHHDNKEGSGYRGASAIRDDVDTLLQINSTKNANTFKLETLTIKPDKGKVLLRPKTYAFDSEGKPVLNEQVGEERVLEVIRERPGISQTELEQRVGGQGITREKLRDIVARQLLGHKIERRKGTGKKVRGRAAEGLYLADATLPDELDAA